MCQQISLEIRPTVDPRLVSVLNRLRETHANGGALFASFEVGLNKDFDWFASRDQLPVFGILRLLLDRAEVSSALPLLKIEPSKPDDPAFVVHRLGDLGPVDPGIAGYGIGVDFEVPNQDYDGEFRWTSPFLFDGELANKLYSGGAYTHGEGDGRAEKENALSFCEALFGLRFSEVSYYSTHSDWTPFFGSIGLDWTAILFDRRTRALSILAVADTD